MDVSGSLTAGGRTVIIIMTHPDNPSPQNQWILRSENSMQNPVFPGRTPVGVSDKTPTVLRYRLVVYQREVPENEVVNLYKEQP